jgi:TonB family protein
MLLDYPKARVPLTLTVSLALHAVLLGLYGSGKLAPAEKKLKLTEVEFIEEAPKPTELEKLMNKLAAPKPPEPKVSARAQAAEAALAELEKTSFRKVVGVHARPAADRVTEADLTHLAALPKFKPGAAAQAPRLAAVPVRKIVLTRAEASPLAELDAKVVPDELPPADFGPDISRRGFQQPELIIKKVKAERRQATVGLDASRRLSLGRDSLISGEVKNREILHREAPPMPRWLEEKGVETEVSISFVVNPDGEVGDKLFVEKTSGYAELDRLAINALKKFVFAPLPLTAKQVEQKGTIVIRFTFHP